MRPIQVNNQVYDAVRAAQAERPAGAPAVPGAAEQIDAAINADGVVDAEEARLREALNSDASFTLTNGSESTPIDPNSLSFPARRPGAATVTPLATPVTPLAAPEGVTEVAGVETVGLAGPTTPVAPLSPAQLIEGSRNTFDLATRQLEAGNGEAAAVILTRAAGELRAGMSAAGNPEKDILNELAQNMEKRAHAYRQTEPNSMLSAAGSLNLYGRNAVVIGDGIAGRHPRYGALMQQVGRDSQIQAQILAQTAGNTKAMIGMGVSQAYRDIAIASITHDIDNTGAINNFFTGNRDDLERDRTRMTEAFNYIDRKMQSEGLTFHEAWHDMFNDHRMASRSDLPTHVTAHEAAVFIRDHQSTRGLLQPIMDISEGIASGNAGKVESGSANLVQTLRDNDQWGISRQVLDRYRASAQTTQGRAEAEQLDANESGQWWRAKATQFAREDLPVLLLTGVLSGGVGLGARALATTAGWGTRAVRAAQVTAELGSFVPTERVLNDVINGRRADWSGGAMARDYALTIGGYGLFKALGAGWRALRAPTPVTPTLAADATRVAGGRPTRVPPNEAPENIRALTRENESAQTLSRRGYEVVQNPPIPGGGGSGVKMPDYRINGHLFDNYAPTSNSARNIWGVVQGKVQSEQAGRIVLNLDNSRVTMEALQKQFADWPIEGLQQVLVVRNGQVIPLPLPRPTVAPPWTPPGVYPHQEQR